MPKNGVSIAARDRFATRQREQGPNFDMPDEVGTARMMLD
jgi:hypothetical protein